MGDYSGWRLLACGLISLGLIAFDGSGGGLPGRTFAQSYQPNSYDQLKPFDHIILSWTGSPATTQAVTWRSHIEFQKSVAEIGPTQDSPDFVKNANKKLEQQARWLENVLKRNPNHWTIVIFHHPVYTSNYWRDNIKVEKHCQPLVDKFKADLVKKDGTTTKLINRIPAE